MEFLSGSPSAPRATSLNGSTNVGVQHDFIPVLNMFPLSNWSTRHIMLYSLLYAALFLIGLCGNVSVITLIRHVHATIPYDNTMIFVLFLCCVDLASVIPLPMAIVDQLLGFWMFGTVCCKIYRTLEHVGRALSTFVLAAMAFDRFQRVWYPHHKTSRSSVFICLATLTLTTFLLLSPIIVNTFAEEIVLKEIRLESPFRLVRVRIFKCIDNIEGDFFTAFILYMFILGFAIPVFLIVLFYGLLVRRLFARSRSIPASQVPVNRIAIYTMAISVFFVVCWSPYWIATLYGLYRSHYPQHHASTTFIYVMYGIHALPYVNSASNWLLYGIYFTNSERKKTFSTIAGTEMRSFQGLLNEELMRRAGNRKKTLTKIEEARQPVMPPMHHLRTVDDTALMPHITDSLL